ncbi:MAG: single-stranded-DNA-specific exonuclease RecJ [Alphaproteobacteria bacterium]
MTAAGAFLGIRQSATGARWQEARRAVNDTDLDRLSRGLTEAYDDMPLPVARLLAARGIDRDQLPSFIEPKLRDLLPDPSRFKDLNKAVARLADCVEAGEPIGVFGDYDVDGACAAALLVWVMRDLGVSVDVHIPDRFTEGYGPNQAALMALGERGASLIVTVDCGITAHAPLAAVASTGMDVIVIDHHIAGPELPKAHSVINPNRLDEDGTYGHLCAAGVTFIVLVGLIRELRRRDFFGTERTPPDLMMRLDLVALATVCDVVPLAGLNRAFVGQGIKIMAQRRHPGLTRLADAAGMKAAPDTYALGFLLGPRINAGGRIGSSQTAVQLLSTLSDDEATGLAAKLDQLNAERRQIEQDIREQAIDRALQAPDTPVIVLSDKSWHEGVIGIVAGRLKERFGKPACVIAMGDDGVGKGSGRSIPGFRLGSAVIAAHQAGILLGGGGHDMAAGFSIDAANLDAFATFLAQRMEKDLNGQAPQLVREVSGTLSTQGAQPELIDWLEKLGPFGSGNPEPRFVLPDCKVKFAKPVGETGAHISCRLDDGSGITLNAIAFQAGGAPLGNLLLDAADGRHIHILGRLKRDNFRGGRAMQIEIEDAAMPMHGISAGL